MDFLRNRITACLITIAILLSVNVIAQEKTPNKETVQATAVLIDTFGQATGEDRSARFDNFFHQILNNPKSLGYVFIYCGKTCGNGEVESHFRGIEIKTAWNKFPRDRLVVLNGGYRDTLQVELWIVSEGACPPAPKSTLNIKDVTFSSATPRFLEAYDCCEDNGELWNRLKRNKKLQD